MEHAFELDIAFTIVGWMYVCHFACLSDKVCHGNNLNMLRGICKNLP